MFVSFELEKNDAPPPTPGAAPTPVPIERTVLNFWEDRKGDLKTAVAQTIIKVVGGNVCPKGKDNVRELTIAAPRTAGRNLRNLLGMDNRTVVVMAYTKLEAAGNVNVQSAKKNIASSVGNSTSRFGVVLLDRIRDNIFETPSEKLSITLGPNVQAVTEGTGTSVPTPAPTVPESGGSNGVSLAIGVTVTVAVLYLCYCYRSRKTTIRKQRARAQSDREKQIELERFGRIAGVRNFEGHSTGPVVPQSSLGRMEGLGSSSGTEKQKRWKKSSSGSMGSFGRHI